MQHNRISVLRVTAGDVMLSDASSGMKQLLKQGAKFEP